jgi:hypothetical protein
MVLGEIGTEKSLPALEKLSSSQGTFFTVKRAADKAIQEIRRRSKD